MQGWAEGWESLGSVWVPAPLLLFGSTRPRRWIKMIDDHANRIIMKLLMHATVAEFSIVNSASIMLCLLGLNVQWQPSEATEHLIRSLAASITRSCFLLIFYVKRRFGGIRRHARRSILPTSLLTGCQLEPSWNLL